MQYINGIPEVVSPFFIIAPLILMLLSGYGFGIIIARIRRIDSSFLKDLTNGSILLNFIFIAGFIVFGVITYSVKLYFLTFTCVLIILSSVGVFFIIKTSIKKSRKEPNKIIKELHMPVLFAFMLFVIVLAYQSVIIYYHPIFEEYDAVYNYLVTSKSILLGDGLHHSYYKSSDISIRSPPFCNAINAWLMDIFGYSSLHLFPTYFIILSSLFLYRFSQTITKDKFLGWISATVFAITPGMLIVSSRFSLSDDLAFILLLTTSFYFLAETISQNRPVKINILLLIVSLAILSLTRELGLFFAIGIFFFFLSAKFTKNFILRILFSIITFLPFYILSITDIHNYGFNSVLTIRLSSLLLSNLGTHYIASKINKYEKYNLSSKNFLYLTPFVIPIIFLTINMYTIHGPYPILTFSNDVNKSMAVFRDLFTIQNKILSDTSIIEKIPRIDLLFIATAVGSTFIFYKLRGFLIIMKEFKKNPYFAVILFSVILLILTWSYFDLGFESAQIRHIAYFIPVLSIAIILGMNKQTIYYKLFYFAIIVFSSYYFIFYNLHIFNYNKHFGSLWIDPYNSSITTIIDIEIAVILILTLLVLELKDHHIGKFLKKNTNKFEPLKYRNYITIAFIMMTGVQVCILVSQEMPLESPSRIDQKPYGGWEENISNVVYYLNDSDSGGVLSLHAPALSFFTNRTNLELYDPYTFTKVLPSLNLEDPVSFKRDITKYNIKYFVLPNEHSALFNETQRALDKFSSLNIIQHDDDFINIPTKSFDIYKFDKTTGINLIDKNHTFTKFEQVKTWYNVNALNIQANTKSTSKLYNRIVFDVNLAQNQPLLLVIQYSTKTTIGNATYYAEIGDKNTKKILWGGILEDTDKRMIKKTFLLPRSIDRNQIQVKFFIITQGAGEHVMTLKSARIIHT